MIDFSVVIPTYNRAEALDKCLQSLYEQTYKDFEVIICDDGSTDNTKVVVGKYALKLSITYLYFENWGGPAKPRNSGVLAARGKWVCFLDSDDWWFSNKLEKCAGYMENYDFIFHNVKDYLGDQPKKINLIHKALKFNYFRSPKEILKGGNFISCSSVCVNKELLSWELFPEDKSIIALEDYFAWIRLFESKSLKIKYLKRELSAYSINDDNISNYNITYLFRLFSFKRKISRELFLDPNTACLNYLIAVNLLHLNEKRKAKIFFRNSVRNAQSFSIRFKSLIRLLR